MWNEIKVDTIVRFSFSASPGNFKTSLQVEIGVGVQKSLYLNIPKKRKCYADFVIVIFDWHVCIQLHVKTGLSN